MQTQAFTIVEVIIFLAVSSLLLVSAFALIAGQQQRAEFTQAINDIQIQINDVINNVATGYYANTGNFKCTSNGVNGPQLSGDTNIQGTNQGCVFIGRAIQFAVKDTNRSGFNVYNLVGQRQIDNSGVLSDVTNLAESKPVAISPSEDPSHASVPNGEEKKQLLYGLQAMTMNCTPDCGESFFGSPIKNSGVVAFVTDFAAPDTGGLTGSTRTVGLYSILFTHVNDDGQTAAEAVRFIDIPDAALFRPVSGVVICFEGGINQHGIITIGGNNRQLSTTLAINNGGCPT